MEPDETRRNAEKLAHSLGIRLFIRDNKIFQFGPGEEVLPAATAKADDHGLGDHLRSDRDAQHG